MNHHLNIFKTTFPSVPYALPEHTPMLSPEHAPPRIFARFGQFRQIRTISPDLRKSHALPEHALCSPQSMPYAKQAFGLFRFALLHE